MFCRNKTHSSFVASVIYKLKAKFISKLYISQQFLLAFKKRTVSFHVPFQLYVGQLWMTRNFNTSAQLFINNF